MESQHIPVKMIGDYMVTKRVGAGSFTVVWKAKHRVHGNKVAIKDVDLQKLNKHLRDCLECEISFLRSVDHPNIIRLLETMEAGDHLFLVLEYCAGGDLAAYIQRYGRVQEQVARKFMQQLGAGLEVLHAHHVIHRDLKPENLLLSTYDSDAVLKIADFGLSRFLSPDEYAETVCGSPLYMAPEVLQFQKYDSKADMWSVGAILFELLNGHPPFNGRSNCQLLKHIKKCTILPFPEIILSGLQPDCVDMCTKLLCQNPVERLSLEEFVHHKFLALM
eukprot:Gb_00516 [translate_table: standard]